MSTATSTVPVVVGGAGAANADSNADGTDSTPSLTGTDIFNNNATTIDDISSFDWDGHAAAARRQRRSGYRKSNSTPNVPLGIYVPPPPPPTFSSSPLAVPSPSTKRVLPTFLMTSFEKTNSWSAGTTNTSTSNTTTTSTTSRSTSPIPTTSNASSSSTKTTTAELSNFENLLRQRKFDVIAEVLWETSEQNNNHHHHQHSHNNNHNNNITKKHSNGGGGGLIFSTLSSLTNHLHLPGSSNHSSNSNHSNDSMSSIGSNTNNNNTNTNNITNSKKSHPYHHHHHISKRKKHHYQQIKEKWFNAEYTMTGENCLHRLVKARPPAYVVSLLLQSLMEYGIDEPELSVDDLGQTPLHHAVANLCHPDVIRVLVEQPKQSKQQQQQNTNTNTDTNNSSFLATTCLVQDDEGKIPLHVAMRPYNLFNNSDKSRYVMQQNPTKIQTIMRSTIEILVHACPPSLTTVQDDKGKTPMEYAKSLVFDPEFETFVKELVIKTQQQQEQEESMANNNNNTKKENQKENGKTGSNEQQQQSQQEGLIISEVSSSSGQKEYVFTPREAETVAC